MEQLLFNDKNNQVKRGSRTLADITKGLWVRVFFKNGRKLWSIGASHKFTDATMVIKHF